MSELTSESTNSESTNTVRPRTRPTSAGEEGT
jgi:hypothetical protein